MHTTLRSALVAAALVTSAAPHLSAQTTHKTTPTRKTASRKPAQPSLAEQIRQMHDDLQGQIDGLKQQLAERDARIQTLQATANQQATTVATQSQELTTTLQQNTDTLNAVKAQVDEVHSSSVAMASEVQDVQKSQEAMRHAIDQPASIHYKGITLTPGGFLAAESVWRQRAMNADIYTNFNATPYPGAGEAHTSEWVPSARQSRLSFLASGKVPFGTISGYFEGDFLSAGTTSNNLQTNSYTLRVRQAWAQAHMAHSTFTGGEMWTLLSEDKTKAMPGQEALPLFFDGNLHVGYTYTRQAGFRYQQELTHQVTLAVALENSQYQFSASNAPSNFFSDPQVLQAA